MKEIKDKLGNSVRVGSIILFPSPSRAYLDRRDLVQGTVTRIVGKKTVEVMLRTGDGRFMSVNVRSFVLARPSVAAVVKIGSTGQRVEVSLKQGLVKKLYRGGAIEREVTQTECIIKIDGFVEGFGKSVTNHRDENNPLEGYRFAIKKALPCIEDKKVRTFVWNQLMKHIYSVLGIG